MSMYDGEAVAVTLLRLLSGRVSDAYLQTFRDLVAANQSNMLATALRGYLVDNQVALTGA